MCVEAPESGGGGGRGCFCAGKNLSTDTLDLQLEDSNAARANLSSFRDQPRNSVCKRVLL